MSNRVVQQASKLSNLSKQFPLLPSSSSSSSSASLLLLRKHPHQGPCVPLPGPFSSRRCGSIALYSSSAPAPSLSSPSSPDQKKNKKKHQQPFSPESTSPSSSSPVSSKSRAKLSSYTTSHNSSSEYKFKPFLIVIVISSLAYVGLIKTIAKQKQDKKQNQNQIQNGSSSSSRNNHDAPNNQ